MMPDEGNDDTDAVVADCPWCDAVFEGEQYNVRIAWSRHQIEAHPVAIAEELDVMLCELVDLAEMLRSLA